MCRRLIGHPWIPPKHTNIQNTANYHCTRNAVQLVQFLASCQFLTSCHRPGPTIILSGLLQCLLLGENIATSFLKKRVILIFLSKKQQHSFILSHCLKMFAIEVRKVSGEAYLPKSLYYMLCAILRYKHQLTQVHPIFRAIQLSQNSIIPLMEFSKTTQSTKACQAIYKSWKMAL